MAKSRSHTAFFMGLSATAPTMPEAKAMAKTLVESYIEQSIQPMIIQFRGNADLLWRNPYGFESRAIMRDGALMPFGSSTTYSSRDHMAIAAMLTESLAQLSWSADEIDDDFAAAAFPYAHDFGQNLGASHKQSLLRWCQCQRENLAAIAA